MKKYVYPEIEVVKLSSEDVITTLRITMMRKRLQE